MSPAHIVPCCVKRVVLEVKMINAVRVNQPVRVVRPACVRCKMDRGPLPAHRSPLSGKPDILKKRPREISAENHLSAAPFSHRNLRIIIADILSVRPVNRNQKLSYFLPVPRSFHKNLGLLLFSARADRQIQVILRHCQILLHSHTSLYLILEISV